MHSALLRSLRLLGLSVVLVVGAQTARTQEGGDFLQNPQAKKLPTDVILVKGAWRSASDSVTPVPEGGTVADNAYINKYFGLTYALEPGWIQKYSGPPPSDSGYYVLAQIRPADTTKETGQGSILIAAHDLFFALAPAANPLELINHTKDKLQAVYKVERPPTPVSIANHPFVRFDYYSSVAKLHWCVLATQIRCHVVQFVLTSRDTKLIGSLLVDMNKMKLPPEVSPEDGTGDDDPVCIKDYAGGENVIERVDPVLTERRFNAIPVRIIIDKDGKVKHIHFLTAFPEQAKSITDALSQWRFKPYLRNGRPVELETGIMFGHAPRTATLSANDAVNK